MDGRRATGAGYLRGTLPGALVLAVLPAAASSLAYGSEISPGDRAYGEYLSTQCVTCHRRPGATEGSIPPIVGLSPAAFVEALLAYKTGERDNQVMRSVTGVLGLEEIAALAAYFASLPPD